MPLTRARRTQLSLLTPKSCVFPSFLSLWGLLWALYTEGASYVLDSKQAVSLLSSLGKLPRNWKQTLSETQAATTGSLLHTNQLSISTIKKNFPHNPPEMLNPEPGQEVAINCTLGPPLPSAEENPALCHRTVTSRL